MRNNYTSTDVVLRTVREAMNKVLVEEMPPYYNLYLEKAVDELQGRTTGFVNHEKRCAFEVLPVTEVVDYDIRLYIYKGTTTRIRQITEDKIKSDNADPTARYFIVDMSLSADYYDRTNSRFRYCPNLFTGLPEIVNVSGVGEDIALIYDPETFIAAEEVN